MVLKSTTHPLEHMEPVLDVRQVTVVLDGETVIRDISFSLERGDITAIVGPNGAGKTTLLRALMGLVSYKGKIEWQPGISVSYVPQRFSVQASAPITVMEFFLLRSDRFWIPRKSFLGEVNHELEQMGLDARVCRQRLGTLSSGQLQRMLLAWSMLNHPDVLLVDEPTASVDVGFAETVYAVLRRLSLERSTSILLVSHDINVVFRYAGNVLCINRELSCQGPPTEALTPEHLKALFGDIAFFPHHHGLSR